MQMGFKILHLQAGSDRAIVARHKLNLPRCPPHSRASVHGRFKNLSTWEPQEMCWLWQETLILLRVMSAICADIHRIVLSCQNLARLAWKWFIPCICSDSWISGFFMKFGMFQNREDIIKHQSILLVARTQRMLDYRKWRRKAGLLKDVESTWATGQLTFFVSFNVGLIVYDGIWRVLILGHMASMSMVGMSIGSRHRHFGSCPGGEIGEKVRLRCKRYKDSRPMQRTMGCFALHLRVTSHAAYFLWSSHVVLDLHHGSNLYGRFQFDKIRWTEFWWTLCLSALKFLIFRLSQKGCRTGVSFSFACLMRQICVKFETCFVSMFHLQ